MIYEVTLTKRVEETILVRGCGTQEEAMAAAKGAANGQKVTDICVKDIKLVSKKDHEV